MTGDFFAFRLLCIVGSNQVVIPHLKQPSVPLPTRTVTVARFIRVSPLF